MRRMYSEQELTNVIKKVFEEELESGALDENVSDAVDAYLVEHPVDVTALEGQDVELNSLDATGLITGGEIVEKMSGYSFSAGTAPSNFTCELKYASVVKNGNKLTFCILAKLSRSDTVGSSYHTMGTFLVPNEISALLVPAISDWLECKKVYAGSTYNTGVDLPALVTKTGNNLYFVIYNINNIPLNTDHLARFEVTFLLSDNLAPEE